MTSTIIQTSYKENFPPLDGELHRNTTTNKKWQSKDRQKQLNNKWKHNVFNIFIKIFNIQNEKNSNIDASIICLSWYNKYKYMSFEMTMFSCSAVKAKDIFFVDMANEEKSYFWSLCFWIWWTPSSKECWNIQLKIKWELNIILTVFQWAAMTLNTKIPVENQLKQCYRA